MAQINGNCLYEMIIDYFEEHLQELYSKTISENDMKTMEETHIALQTVEIIKESFLNISAKYGGE